MSKVIEKVLAKNITVDMNVDGMTEQMKELHEKKGRLLPVEYEAMGAVDKEINRLDMLIKRAETAKVVGQLPMLDPSVFGWTRKQEGWRKRLHSVMVTVPSLAYMPVNSDELKLMVSTSHWDNRISPNTLPNSVVNQYDVTMKRIAQESLSNRAGKRSLHMSYKFNGLVPDDIREKIQEQREKRLFEQIAFVCEVDRWEIHTVDAPPRQWLDPILVGVRNGRLWVLDKFDPKPLENYALNEFTK